MRKLQIACVLIGGGGTLLGSLGAAIAWSRWFIGTVQPEETITA